MIPRETALYKNVVLPAIDPIDARISPMPRFIQPLLLVLARLTDRPLAGVVQYLKAENEILRSKLPKRITVTPRERQRLIKFGRPLGTASKHLITIVSPRTFARWLKGDEPGARPRRGPGRPRTPVDLQELVLRIARETGWGYTKILGELKKLRLGRVCRSTVVNILKEAGLDPGPKRGEHTWAEFISTHAATLWQCDFFSHKVLTWRGWKEYFVLAFIHAGSRRVFVSPATRKPDAAWMQGQATAFLGHLRETGQVPGDTILFRDRDGKYTPPFDDALKAAGVNVRKTPVRSPNLAAYVERWIQSVRVECLDRMIAIGETHFNYLVREYVAYHNLERPHQSLGNRPLPEANSPDPPVLPFPEGGVDCHRRLDGLLLHYRRAALIGCPRVPTTSATFSVRARPGFGPRSVLVLAAPSRPALATHEPLLMRHRKPTAPPSHDNISEQDGPALPYRDQVGG